MDKAKPRFLAHNLGLHLLIASADTDVVAICLHPLDLREAESSHALLDKEGVPWLSPNPPLARPLKGLKADRRLDYELARATYGDRPVKIAAHLGVTPKTLRHWKRAGKV